LHQDASQLFDGVPFACDLLAEAWQCDQVPVAQFLDEPGDVIVAVASTLAFCIAAPA